MDSVTTGPTRRAFVAGGLAAGLAGCEGLTGPTVMPAVALPGLPGLKSLAGWPVPGIGERQFVGQVSLVNVWASWCPVCRGEHRTLMRLSNDGRFSLVGLVHLDTAEKAVAYLRQAGNPYRAAAVDRGDYARALGQRGVPATYVIDRTGRVVEAARGGINDDYFRARLMPAIQGALAA